MDLLDYNLSIKYIAEKNNVSEDTVRNILINATLPNRKKEYLIQYFVQCKNRYSVEVIISDMYEPYLFVTRVMLQRAIFVVDRFHYTTYIMNKLDNIRRLQK